jgi:hypothetical protein
MVILNILKNLKQTAGTSIFTLLKGESFNDLLNFLGDFTESAFKA